MRKHILLLVECPISSGGVFYEIFNFLFGTSHDSATLSKIKQNIHLLKENQSIQLKQMGEQYVFN